MLNLHQEIDSNSWEQCVDRKKTRTYNSSYLLLDELTWKMSRGNHTLKVLENC